jgi:hypothetical protein
MNKEELRKEFESICDTQLHDDLYRPDFEKMFDWFYSKLEKLEKENQKLNLQILMMLEQETPQPKEEQTWMCYEICRPNIPDYGCTEQCKECKQKQLEKK